MFYRLREKKLQTRVKSLRNVSQTTRFLLFSKQRSGTHFLMHELRRHKDIHTYDEIFFRHHRLKTFGAAHLRRALEMFFGYREYEDGYIDGVFRCPFLPSTPGSRRSDAASTALSGNLSGAA